MAIAFCFGILLSTIFWGMAVNLVSSDGEIVLGGERFVRVVAEPVEKEVVEIVEERFCAGWICEEWDTVLGDIVCGGFDVNCSRVLEEQCVVRSKVWRRC